jgi:hypothetical protein
VAQNHERRGGSAIERAHDLAQRLWQRPRFGYRRVHVLLRRSRSAVCKQTPALLDQPVCRRLGNKILSFLFVKEHKSAAQRRDSVLKPSGFNLGSTQNYLPNQMWNDLQNPMRSGIFKID